MNSLAFYPMRVPRHLQRLTRLDAKLARFVILRKILKPASRSRHRRETR